MWISRSVFDVGAVAGLVGLVGCCCLLLLWAVVLIGDAVLLAFSLLVESRGTPVVNDDTSAAAADASRSMLNCHLSRTSRVSRELMTRTSLLITRDITHSIT